MPTYCLFCGELLRPKQRPSGRLEPMSSCASRKYCNRICQGKARRKEASHFWARQIKGRGACENCGSNTNVDVHHKDGNVQNNDIQNLMWLCRSCHKHLHCQVNPCVICGRPRQGWGYCSKHYQRFKKYGDPLLTRKKWMARGWNPIFKSVD